PPPPLPWSGDLARCRRFRLGVVLRGPKQADAQLLGQRRQLLGVGLDGIAAVVPRRPYQREALAPRRGDGKHTEDGDDGGVVRPFVAVAVPVAVSSGVAVSIAVGRDGRRRRWSRRQR